MTGVQTCALPILKINNFQGELTDVSAKKEALVGAGREEAHDGNQVERGDIRTPQKLLIFKIREPYYAGSLFRMNTSD